MERYQGNTTEQLPDTHPCVHSFVGLAEQHLQSQPTFVSYMLAWRDFLRTYYSHEEGDVQLYNNNKPRLSLTQFFQASEDELAVLIQEAEYIHLSIPDEITYARSRRFHQSAPQVILHIGLGTDIHNPYPWIFSYLDTERQIGLPAYTTFEQTYVGLARAAFTAYDGNGGYISAIAFPLPIHDVSVESTTFYEREWMKHACGTYDLDRLRMFSANEHAHMWLRAFASGMFILPSHLARLSANHEVVKDFLVNHCRIVEIFPDGKLYLQLEDGLSITNQINSDEVYDFLRSVDIHTLSTDCSDIKKYIVAMHSRFVQERLA